MADMCMCLATLKRSTNDECSHQNLKLVQFDNRSVYNCEGCQEMGYGSCYHCTTTGCYYRLHAECATASSSCRHRFYRYRQFDLRRNQLPENSTPTKCAACAGPVRGWAYIYTSFRRTVFLHPRCMRFPVSVESEGNQFLLHEKLATFKCQLCEQKNLIDEEIKGWAYVSADKELVGHVKCIKHELFRLWEKHSKTRNLEKWWFGDCYGGSIETSQPSHGLVTGSSSGGTQGTSSQAMEPYQPKHSWRKDYLWKLAAVAVQILVLTVSQ